MFKFTSIMWILLVLLLGWKRKYKAPQSQSAWCHFQLQNSELRSTYVRNKDKDGLLILLKPGMLWLDTKSDQRTPKTWPRIRKSMLEEMFSWYIWYCQAQVRSKPGPYLVHSKSFYSFLLKDLTRGLASTTPSPPDNLSSFSDSL